MLPAGGQQTRHNVRALDGGFVEPTDDRKGVGLSPNGLDWESVALPFDGYVNEVMSVGDDAVVFVADETGRVSMYQLDVPTLAWSVVEIEGLPDAFYTDLVVDGAASLRESEVATSGSVFGWRTTAEYEGYAMELVVQRGDASETVSYTLTDVASGEVVLTESIAMEQLGNGGGFEHAVESYDVEGEEGMYFYDPESGDLLVGIPFEESTQTAITADGNEVEMPEITAEPVRNPAWLLASDGEKWLLAELPNPPVEVDADGDVIAMAGVGSVVVNNGIVLATAYDGSVLRADLN